MADKKIGCQFSFRQKQKVQKVRLKHAERANARRACAVSHSRVRNPQYSEDQSLLAQNSGVGELICWKGFSLWFIHLSDRSRCPSRRCGPTCGRGRPIRCGSTPIDRATMRARLPLSKRNTRPGWVRELSWVRVVLCGNACPTFLYVYSRGITCGCRATSTFRSGRRWAM